MHIARGTGKNKKLQEFIAFDIKNVFSGASKWKASFKRVAAILKSPVDDLKWPVVCGYPQAWLC